MNVKNRRCIRRLGFRQLKAAKLRNIIAIVAIMLTTLLFTSLFTIAMSISSSYEEYNFRQAGGYCHGTFKEVNKEQWRAIASHPKVKETGARKVAGYTIEGMFAKVPAEISWMDENCTKWSYATPTTGRMPKEGYEISMDTASLEGLGVEPKLGEEVTITYEVANGVSGAGADKKTQTFTLVGFWEYDGLMPVHYMNVTRDYVDSVEQEQIAKGKGEFRVDLNVMLSSSIGIEKVMQSIDEDLGYQWEDREAENCVRIGVNWGYVASEMDSNVDFSLVASILAFICLVIFTGYLIIYNVFRISVTNDIRFYGMLKTIGTTPRQLKRIIRFQAFALSFIGIPLGILLGYGVGAFLLPVVMGSLGTISVTKISLSPVIFIGAVLFSLVTVCLSVSRPGKMAAKVSPVEALRYTEQSKSKKQTRNAKRVHVLSMAFANLGRSRSKTVLVVLSLSLAVVLLSTLVTFVDGFDMEKYVSHNIDSDFLVGTTDYFRFHFRMSEGALPDETVEEIKEHTSCSLEGSAYSVASEVCYVTEDMYRKTSLMPEKYQDEYLDNCRRKGDLVESELLLEGIDESLFSKLTVLEGNIEPLKDKDSHQIAICVHVDDYGNPYGEYLEVGESLPVTYISEATILDSRTGEPADETTPMEYLEEHVEIAGEVEYTICAKVILPYSMGFRYSTGGQEALLSTKQLKNDSNMELSRMFYTFDTPDHNVENEAEEFLAEYTKKDSLGIMYESKKLVREDFGRFRSMFLLVGGVLCIIVAMVGILNFFNAILTGIITRRREFAMLQSIGMTGKQLKSMLVWEGIFYALCSIFMSFILTLLLEPLAGEMFEGMFWFFSFRFRIYPVFLMLPVFLLFGVLLPLAGYRFLAGKSIVERLRESDT